MNRHAIRLVASVGLMLPFLAIGGCVVSGIGPGVDSGIGSGFGSGYGIGGKSTAIGKVEGVRALGDGDVDIDPYTLQPYGVGPYGTGAYGNGLDSNGYPVADWYGGYGYAYPGYVIGAAGLVSSAGSTLTGAAPAPVRAIPSHPGLRPHLGGESGFRADTR